MGLKLLRALDIPAGAEHPRGSLSSEEAYAGYDGVARDDRGRTDGLDVPPRDDHHRGRTGSGRRRHEWIGIIGCSLEAIVKWLVLEMSDPDRTAGGEHHAGADAAIDPAPHSEYESRAQRAEDLLTHKQGGEERERQRNHCASRRGADHGTCRYGDADCDERCGGFSGDEQDSAPTARAHKQANRLPPVAHALHCGRPTHAAAASGVHEAGMESGQPSPVVRDESSG